MNQNMNTNKTQDQRIVEWNEERLLIKSPEELDMVNEMAYILEEVIEGLTPTKSEQAREHALVLAKSIALGELPAIVSKIKQYQSDTPCFIPKTDETMNNFVDALGDIKVFATGSIRKAGYDPDLAMEEVLQEIESRTGQVINGKYTKDKSPEAQAKWYKADFDNAKIK